MVKVHEEPTVYVYDTPGIMLPFLGHGEMGAERGLKYALTGRCISCHFCTWQCSMTAGIKEDVFEAETVIDYLLWRMNQRLASEQSLPPDQRNPTYLDVLPLPPTFTAPTDNLYELLDPLCQKIGALQKGGIPDHNSALRFITKYFREGKLGRWTFDKLEPPVPELGYMPAELGAKGKELDEIVSGTVGKYLDWMQAQRVEEERGANLSPTQIRKREAAEKKVKIQEKWKRRMTDRGKDVHRMLTGQRSEKWGGKKSKPRAR